MRKAMVSDRWVANRGVRLHVLETGRAAQGRSAVLLVPGVSGRAEDFLALMESLAPRRCAALDLRGRGRSDAPPTGYALEDHVSDLEAAAVGLRMRQFCLLAHSRSVAYALGYALGHGDRPTGLILLDYPAQHSRLPPGWADHFLRTTFLGTRVCDRIRARVVRQIQRESLDVSFWDQLGEIRCPVLVMRGSAKGSLLSAEDADRYRERLRSVQVEVFAESGHVPWEPDFPRFASCVRGFLEDIDVENRMSRSRRAGTGTQRRRVRPTRPRPRPRPPR